MSVSHSDCALGTPHWFTPCSCPRFRPACVISQCGTPYAVWPLAGGRRTKVRSSRRLSPDWPHQPTSQMPRCGRTHYRKTPKIIHTLLYYMINWLTWRNRQSDIKSMYGTSTNVESTTSQFMNNSDNCLLIGAKPLSKPMLISDQWKLQRTVIQRYFSISPYFHDHPNSFVFLTASISNQHLKSIVILTGYRNCSHSDDQNDTNLREKQK